MKLLTVSLLVALVGCCTGSAHPHLPKFLLGRPTGSGFLRHGQESSEAGEPATNLVNDYVDQLVDNFDDSNKNTYKQQYWYNPSFTRNQSIVFLMIQGESPATATWITNPNYQYLTWAKEFGADVFQLEHRCFGKSRPYPDMSFPGIKVCTIAQALRDVHNFIQKMNQKFNFKNPKWVTFGGSYPGALSALFRANYPADTVGAIASSAPLHWVLDYFQYAEVVQSVLTQTDPACSAAVNDAFFKMQQYSLNENDILKLNKYFTLDPPFVTGNYTQHDIDNFFANLYSFFQGVVQYTYDGRNDATKNGLDVKHLCAKMTDNTEPDVVKRVANTIDWINKMNGDPVGPLANSYSQMMVALSNVTYDDESPVPGDMAANRGWMWLCCNELGALQTTDLGRNIFQQTVPLNYFVDMCTEMFDPSVDIKYIRDHNLQTQALYGGVNGYKATNVVLPNGSFDPWHPLGLNVTDKASHRTSLLIQGAAHCSDMYPVYSGEPTDLAANRKIIHDELKYFLGL